MAGLLADAGEPSAPRYDGYADWYDAWAQDAGAAAMATARAALEELLPDGPGLALDVGCGTGLHAESVRRRGLTVLGLDYSADQLRLARTRLPVVRAAARALPLATGSVRLAYSVLTHTDLEGFHRLVAESVRVLAPRGAFLYVGVHPCFVGPFAERLADGVRLHPGYRSPGWQASTAFLGDAVRRRVGVHHLPLEQLLTAFVHPAAPLDRVLERGGGAVPELLAVRLRRRDLADPGVGVPA